MSLTVEELAHVRAQWEEWVPGEEFVLSIEVKDSGPPPSMLDVDVGYTDTVALGAQLGARLESQLYLQVQIRRDEQLVFDQVCPHDAAALRASVSVLARTIAANIAGEGAADDGSG